ncbi:hypothetical protein F2P56_012972 [Juglans regia]|uniref:UDP-glycosyltransferase 89B2-like n=1 Tax=Juglans regia TaxID=51240 RepID=A0A833XNP2_JUGRE|nr:hypothetical protein F2P56_012972 [Juglans regia]
MSTNGVHIAAYPYPTSGHIIPLLDLAHRLLTRGLTVTVFVTTSNLPLLQPYISTHPSSLKHLVLPSPDITAPPQKRLLATMRALRDLHYPILLQWFRSHSSPPVAIISDFFLGWTRDLACELGFVIRGWAPQVTILSHRAVGVFLTHCGWNSVLEGITAGVVMLTWPMGADQYSNAKLLVDELGVAIRACEGTQNIPTSAELARLLASSVDETRPERLLAKELSAAAVSAVNGGSSDTNLDEFIKQLGDLGK